MSFDRVVPIANIEIASRTELKIDRYKAQIGGEYQIPHVLFFETKRLTNPLMHFNTICWFVSRFDKCPTKLGRKVIGVHKLVATCPGIRLQTVGSWVLTGIGRIEGMKSSCKDRMACYVPPPVVECNAPGIGAWIRTKRDQPLCARCIAKPTTVLLTYRPVGSFNLRMMKDRLANNQVAFG